MERKGKEKIRKKHLKWVTYRLADFVINDVLNENEKISKHQKGADLLRKLGNILGNGMEIHHDWDNNPNEIYDYLPREEHRRLYHL